MELSEILYNKAEYIETVIFLKTFISQLAVWLARAQWGVDD